MAERRPGGGNDREKYTAAVGAVLSAGLLKDAQAVTANLARNIGEQAAVCLVHTGALLQHAAGAGLIAPAGDLAADAEQLASLHPGLASLVDPAVNPALHTDTAAIGDLWARYDVTDRPYRPDGYLIGDLYQQLSVEARKGRALCQTPQFVTELLLDISFDHAYREHGPHIRMIDPTCGTGHILVESLVRASSLQQFGFGRAQAPALPVRTEPLARITAALATVHGVDLDPYAALIARYRLLVMARAMLRAHRYEPSPADLAGLPLNVAAADSLLAVDEPLLERGTYHAVIANPPYITVKDAAVNAAIRARYREVCNGKYSLALPCHALMNDLLVPGGWCAQLTASSFMKREFGRAYVEDYLTQYDLRWVIDTSGAYIPGHGTPTVILVNRNQAPTSDTVHTILGNRGEPRQPEDPARGLVWQAIAESVRSREAQARFEQALDALRPAAEPPAPAAPAPAAPRAYTQPTLFDLTERAA
ncbi:hypothetical protein [Streptosporangium sp. NPDC002524]|uniref:Eco57I restriction-modification methylase domain-containing protein n=1 Tax=Streptosporangium sp. NPDC002524 TaxID=3154537 RepID=UPI003334827E